MKAIDRFTGKTFIVLRVSSFLSSPTASQQPNDIKIYVCEWEETPRARFFMDEATFNNTAFSFPEDKDDEDLRKV